MNLQSSDAETYSGYVGTGKEDDTIMRRSKHEVKVDHGANRRGEDAGEKSFTKENWPGRVTARRGT